MTIPIGTIVAYGGLVEGRQKAQVKSQGWLICDGEAVSRDDYSELFDVIGNFFGGGDGVTTFNLPDLQGRFLRGADNGTRRDPDAQFRIASAPGGNTGAQVGSYQDDAFKKHFHAVPVKGDDGNTKQAVSIDPGQRTVGSYPSYDAGDGNETRPKNIYVNYIIKAKDVS